MSRPHRLMYGLLYPAVLGTVFVNLLPALFQLINGAPTPGTEAHIKLLLVIGIVAHFVVDYLLVQETPEYEWSGFALDFCVLLALWTAATSVHLGRTERPELRTLCFAIAAAYAVFLLWLGRLPTHAKRPLLVAEAFGLLWFLLGALWFTTWFFALAGLLLSGAWLALAASKSLRILAAGTSP